jgi:hypothetical protein
MNKEEFCYPSDFFYMDKDILKERYESNKYITIIALLIWLIQGILCMFGYYITFPFVLLFKLCENRCFY